VIFSKYNFYSILLIIFYTSCAREELNGPVDDIPVLPPPAYISFYYSTDGEIGVEWEPVKHFGLDGYVVYMSSGGNTNFSKQSFLKQNYFFIDSLSYDSTYYFYVATRNKNGIESNPGDTIYTKPLNRYVPPGIRNLGINAVSGNGEKRIDVDWSPPYVSDIAGYNIYRNSTVFFEPVEEYFHARCDDTFFSDTSGLIRGKTYYYLIETFDKGFLKSSVNSTTRDLVMVEPEIIYPVNNQILIRTDNFIIKCYHPILEYRLLICDNSFFISSEEYLLHPSSVDSLAAVPLNSMYLDELKFYYAKVIAFTGFSAKPGSYSAVIKFRVKSE